MIDHCVSLFRNKMTERAYRNYVTDTLKLINDNLTKSFGGKVLKNRYADLVATKKEPEKSGDDIARDIIKRAGLKVRK